MFPDNFFEDDTQALHAVSNGIFNNTYIQGLIFRFTFTR